MASPTLLPASSSVLASTPYKPVRTGIIGYGLAGRVFHAPFVRAVPNLQLAAIVQRTGDTAAQQNPEATVFRSVNELLASNVELIIVATPNDTHLPLARQALQAGKHVVIDKPFTPTLAGALELEALATERHLLLAPFHNRRWDGDFLTLQTILRSGELGRVVTLRSRFDRFRPGQRPNSWKEAASSDNGLLLDLGSHLVDQAIVLFGRPETLAASIRTDRDRSDIDDAFDMTLTFRTGEPGNERTIRVELGSSMLSADPQPRFLLHGTRGSFRKTGVDPQEPAILAGATVPPLESDSIWLTEPEVHWGTLTAADSTHFPPTLTARTLPTQAGDYRRFYAGIASALQHGTPPPTTPRDGVRVARLLELARESNRTGQTLRVAAEVW